MIHTLEKMAEHKIMSKRFLRNLKMEKKDMIKLLSSAGWRRRLTELAREKDFTAAGMVQAVEPVLDKLADPPEGGWMHFICDSVKASLYPENFSAEVTEDRRRAVLFFLENYRAMLAYEREHREFSPVDDLDLLPKEATDGCVTAREYDRLRKFWNDHYIYEFMRISREITPFNTVGHIGGVHYVALFIGKQLAETDIPVDLALVSSAAACHDLGKFGCSPKEEKRIPYLHYYYTNELLIREKMPMTAHIASNHSTWDLELENLSAESLLLIYADFRVKSIREDGAEHVCFYTLDQSFEVILHKLDNVDAAKKQRYERVYAKLKDFENYLKDMGIETDVTASPVKPNSSRREDTVLLAGDAVVEQLKYTAIQHNMKIMSIFNNELAFGNLLEAARSEKKWKSLRAYLNILSEYFTYMTKHEKQLTIHFLYDLLSHREGDIRRQAGALLGQIIANYDDVYRKELPDNVSRSGAQDSISVWGKYLNMIVSPDYRATDQHRSWIGYTLKVVIRGLLENTEPDKRMQYMEKYFALFQSYDAEDSGVFVLLDSVVNVPRCVFRREDRLQVLRFAAAVSARDPIEIKLGALRAAEAISQVVQTEETSGSIREILQNTEEMTSHISVAYLTCKLLHNIGDEAGAKACQERIDHIAYDDDLKEDAVSRIFRENLKVGTPWVVKTVNIDFLLDYIMERGMKSQIFHLAAHFSNLIKVSERVTVRHKAGRGLLRIARALPMEQINEIVIELTKGLEIGEYQFSKYIPEYLGELALHLDPGELDEFIATLQELIESTNDRIASVALDTLGETLRNYSGYRTRQEEPEEVYEARKQTMLGMLLKGLADYHEVVRQEAFLVIGQYIFGSSKLSQDEIFAIFQVIYKKLLTLVMEERGFDMNFLTNAAALNHIYRFISEYHFQKGSMILPENRTAAFFPGTFDPFSLSHKGIVQAIRDAGFEVYLALDEFSWSKKTQPRKIRRKIIEMSVADEPDVYLFPDDLPVNIANPDDLKRLREIFPGRELYMVVGSDVITNASSYRAEPSEYSIHSMNHLVFRRETLEAGNEDREKLQKNYARMTGKIQELTLPVYLEDISSTRIRENIDRDRDISNLIDPVAQNYIYDNSLYLREPQYKNVLERKNIVIEPLEHRESTVLKKLSSDVHLRAESLQELCRYMDRSDVKTAVIRDRSGKIQALAAVNEIETGDLYREFQDIDIAAYLRQKATGRMLIIRGLYGSTKADMRNLLQHILTEVLAQAVAGDLTYAIYHPLEQELHKSIRELLLRQGFVEMGAGDGRRDLYEVNMKEPIAVIDNMETVLKKPFNTTPKIRTVLEKAHGDMQMALTGLNPGNLVLSFNAGIINHKIVDMVTEANHVPNYPLKVRQLGECMCVPFGKILRGMAVPNTVTKTLHTEKMFSPALDSFTIEEYPMYATIPDQVRTIHSFGRPVILVDDLLHKGYRMKALDPVFHENGLQIRKIITGLLSGQGKDLMAIQGREVESAYFIPNLKNWFVESTMCPFIGGDGVQSEERVEANLIPSVNQVLPFAAPSFIHGASREAVYHLSMVSLENARRIFLALEEEYQNVFERKLTIKRLSDAVISPRMPNGADRVAVDPSLAPSVYMEDYKERLRRLESALK